MNTALKLPFTEASGWSRGTSVGCTRTPTWGSPSAATVCSATASSLMQCFRSAANSMSDTERPEIPSWYTSPATTRAPKAMVAMMAALAPAS